MALSRRNGQRFQASIWPGFVDAMTGLLLVLIFVLSILMVVQYVLRDTISGQETELDQLSAEVAALSQALGLEQRRAADLTTRVGALDATIVALRNDAAQSQEALSQAQSQITSFEAQVVALIAERDGALGTVATLEADQARLLSEQEALNLALAAARSEIDAGAEAARLAAARREALEALIADLQNKEAALTAQATDLTDKLSQEEAARLAEAAAAQALRARLEAADSEITAMTLALEAQRKRAEETLTLLAAAQTAEKDLTAKLAAAVLQNESATAQIADFEAALEAARTAQKLTQEQAQDALAQALAAKLAAEQAGAEQLTKAEQRAALLASAQAALAEQEAKSADAARDTALLNQQLAALRGQLGQLQALLDDYKERDASAQVQMQTLGSDLNAALARAAAEERRRRQLEEDERKRLEAETKNLEKYKSEFFGRLRDVLGAQEGVKIVGDRFVFSSEVLFPVGSAELAPAGRAEIAKIADILRSIAGDIPEGIDWVIRVDGHTDDVPLSGQGAFKDNWELSQARALSVVRYMSDFLGIPPDRLAANGFGQYQPVNPANTPEARAQNRRIELKFTEK